MAFNNELVELAERGDLDLLARHIEGRGTMKVLYWHLIKACRAAAIACNTETFRLLKALDPELDFSHVAFKGILPVLVTSEHPSEEAFVEVLEMLIEGGLSIHDTEKDEYCTALHIACMQDNLFLVTTLLQHEADANAINRRGLMPLNLASSPEVIEVLKQYGAVASWREDLPSHA
eukprot:CAMPEP_0204915384 /NCGR_PEP_ID=MMETSP1397-20131031/13392_1 /ASSEMBLY_ACC=CAM_ASM_000891 /TAXON_ID=49980 /ORGANISM="Climacostomum Climacostomum virens, Strain Stock W-24" /LENGTH=175 /DNA_ID=CAMNT_0052087399 /DNA_START=541 /DNA_END=1068 /DNA_ORIENTATION=-